ncbi:MAG: DUF2274 domain-containing protein [Bryobacteraceae bacterium]
MSAIATPLIEPEDKTPDEKMAVSLRPEIAQDLRAYAEYANNSSSSHIISAALKRLFTADKGFKSFKEANPTAGVVTANNGSHSRRRGRRPKAKSSASVA